MLIVPVLMALSFGLLVSLAGFFALNYVNKEGLGNLFKYTSYLTIVVGKLIFVGGIVCAVMITCCHHGGCNDNVRCNVEMRGKHCSSDKDACNASKEKCEKKCDTKKACTKSCEKSCTKSCEKDVECKKVISKEAAVEKVDEK